MASQITKERSEYILHFIIVCQPFNSGMFISLSPQLEYKSVFFFLSFHFNSS